MDDLIWKQFEDICLNFGVGIVQDYCLNKHNNEIVIYYLGQEPVPEKRLGPVYFSDTFSKREQLVKFYMSTEGQIKLSREASRMFPDWNATKHRWIKGGLHAEQATKNS